MTNPPHFNELFRVSAISMRAHGVFNPEIGVDNNMFVDPKLLEDAKDELSGAHSDLMDYFAGTVSLIKLVKTRRDVDIAWARAWKRMKFKETANTCLGFSKDGTEGNGIGKVLAQRIVNRAIDILPHVNYEPDVFELIGVFTEGLGCDRLSDMIVSILKPRFLAYTDRVTRTLGIQLAAEFEYQGKRYFCPRLKKGDKPIILLPQDILKPLPIALNIEEALTNADLNENARQQVNKIFSDAYKQGAAPSRNQLRAAIRSNSSMYLGILSGYRRAKPVHYDFDLDPAHVSDFMPIAREIVGSPVVNKEGLDSWERVKACVTETIRHLRRSIEENRLSEVLFDDTGAPRREIISQRVIYSIATIFGKLYDVDVSREGNAGSGAVDFRFTVGHQSRLLVEVKLSTHERLRDGYYSQLPAYGKAEAIKHLVLLVIRVTNDDAHLRALEQSVKANALPIQVVVIDAMPKPSASKRKSPN